jgi:NodT family efflux transporter outer membrane factor (OMF) lipoprotein
LITTARAGLGLGLAASLLAGCVVGPRYTPPTPPAPSSGAFAEAGSALTAPDAPPPNWWKLYDTPAIDQLVEDALAHNTSLLAAAANLAEARAALSLARSGLFPSTSVSAGYQYGVTSNTVFADNLLGRPPSNATGFYQAGLDASYEVDLFGRVRRTIEAAKGDYQAQQAARDVMRISVAGETTRAYLDACGYAEQLAAAHQSLDLVTQTYEMIVAEAKNGAASDLDVARAHVQVAQVQATLPTLEGERRTALFQLAVLTGQPPEAISKDADRCAAPPKLTTVLPVGDVASLFKRRPDVRQAERQLAANIARIGVATADLYPTITIGASASSAASTLSGLSSRQNLAYGIGPLLSWTFPNTLAALAEIREAKATASASYANFQGTVLQALQDVEGALATYGGELDRNRALTLARDQSEVAFKLARTQFQLGRISYLDVLTAQTDLVNVTSALAQSDMTLASDQVTVFKALGGGWEQAPPIQPLPIASGSAGEMVH